MTWPEAFVGSVLILAFFAFLTIMEWKAND